MRPSFILGRSPVIIRLHIFVLVLVNPITHRILVLVKGDRQMGSQVNPTAIPISTLVKRSRQEGSHTLALVKGNR